MTCEHGERIRKCGWCNPVDEGLSNVQQRLWLGTATLEEVFGWD